METSTCVAVKEDPIEVVVHAEETDGQKKLRRRKAAMELLANDPDVFTNGFLQSEVVLLDLPHLTSTEAAIVVEAARFVTKWKDFVLLIFQIYPHDRVTLNMKRVEHLWPHVLLFQGKDPES